MEPSSAIIELEKQCAVNVAHADTLVGTVTKSDRLPVRNLTKNGRLFIEYRDETRLAGAHGSVGATRDLGGQLTHNDSRAGRCSTKYGLASAKGHVDFELVAPNRGESGMLLRLAKGLFLAVVLLVFDGSALNAATELPPTPADIGLPRAPTIIGLPVASQFRAGVLVRRPDGRLGFAPAPRPAPRPSSSDITVTKPLAPPTDLSSLPASRRALDVLVRKLAPQYGLDPDLVVAVIAAESSFRVDAVSSRGATGLMQLVPETARRFGVENSYDPEQNLRGGRSYLRWLLS